MQNVDILIFYRTQQDQRGPTVLVRNVLMTFSNGAILADKERDNTLRRRRDAGDSPWRFCLPPTAQKMLPSPDRLRQLAPAIMVACAGVGYLIKAQRRGEKERALHGGNYGWRDEAMKQRAEMEEGWKRMMGVPPSSKSR